MTQLMYLQDPSLFEVSATIQGAGVDKKGVYFTVNRSLFYPQGGGQPADKGKVLIKSLRPFGRGDF